jgi:hypothetical protein
VVEKLDPARFKLLQQSAERHAAERVSLYQQMAQIKLPLVEGAEEPGQADDAS